MRRFVTSAASALRRLPRLPGRVVPYAAHPLETVRMLVSADARRAFPIDRDISNLRLAAVCSIAAVLVAVFVPYAWIVVVVLFGAEASAALWYRWQHGSRRLVARGLPPGQLTILPTPLLDADHLAREWSRRGPVFTTNTLTHPTVAIGGLRLGIDTLHDHRDDLRVPERADNAYVEGGFVRNQYGERHRHTRAAIAVAFSPSMVGAVRPALDAAIGRHLDAWAIDSAASGTRGLALLTRVEQLVLDTWIRVFFGIDATADAPLHARLMELYPRFDYQYPERSSAEDRDAIAAIVLDRSRHTTELPPCALRSLAERSPESLGDPSVIANLVHLVHTSRYDVAGLVMWLIHRLAHHQEWSERVRAAPDDTPAAWVVSETLRLSQAEYVFRQTTCPIEIEGYRIPADWFLRVLVRESHRDPEVFADPDRFDPCRFADRTYPRTEYSPFGLDGRACLGESLARTMGIAVVRALSTGYAIRVVADGAPEYAARRFWAPSSEFRLAIDRIGTGSAAAAHHHA